MKKILKALADAEKEARKEVSCSTRSLSDEDFNRYMESLHFLKKCGHRVYVSCPDCKNCLSCCACDERGRMGLP